MTRAKRSSWFKVSVALFAGGWSSTVAAGSTPPETVTDRIGTPRVAAEACSAADLTDGADLAGNNSCPEITLIFAAPLQTNVGGTIVLEASALDPDGDKLAYRWRATSGKIAAPRSANTTYTCTSAGSHTLTLSVTDRRCSVSQQIPVTCI